MTNDPEILDDVVDLWGAYAEVLRAAAGLVEALPEETVMGAPFVRLSRALDALRPPMRVISDTVEPRSCLVEFYQVAADALGGKR